MTPTAAPQTGRGSARGAVDPRVQQRTYTCAETNEQMPYALFVSSKVTSDRKNPLIVSLHGLGGDQNTMCGRACVPWAGWYGIPPGPPRPPNAGGGGTPRPVIGGTAITDPAKVREASAKDVMTVLGR